MTVQLSPRSRRISTMVLRVLLVTLVVTMLWLHIGHLLFVEPDPLGVALGVTLTAALYATAMRLWYLGWVAR